MIAWTRLLLAELRKHAIERLRYLGDFISSIITIYVVFLAIFYGFSGLAGPELPGARLEVLILVYLSWLFALTGLQTFSTEVQDEMQRGTLEQLYLSPYGISAILIARGMVELVASFILIAIILTLMMLTSGIWIPVLNIQALAAILIALPSLWGVGLALGGLILINKRAGGLLSILNFALVALVAFDAYPLNLLSFLPFSAGAATMRAVLLEGARLSLPWAMFLAAVSVVYMVIGIIVYALFERSARRRNLLGQY